jgi:hypothetical protein
LIFSALSYTAGMKLILPAEFKQALKIALHFDLAEPIEICDFPQKGNINQQSYLITAGPANNREQYILQLLNPEVFTQPRAVMNGMISCIREQRKALSEGGFGPDEWETIRLIPTKDGKNYLLKPGRSGNECWRMMVRIRDVVTFRSLHEISALEARIRVAEEAGRGLAFFGNLTAGMNASGCACPLPGYRDTELYYHQLSSVLAGHRSPQEAIRYLPYDPEVRKSTEPYFTIQIDPAEYRRRMEDSQLRHYINLALEQQPFALQLVSKLKSGALKKVVIHGDTKLDNFLFSARTGKVIALVDLDTIMPHTWLSDWGDMVRSLVNISGERERDLEKIDVDREVLKALARGFLDIARHTDSSEIDLMVDAPQIMALELGVRFLADYLRGDSYFKLKAGEPQDLNKTRAMVQFRLFERMRSLADSTRQLIRSYCR